MVLRRQCLRFGDEGGLGFFVERRRWLRPRCDGLTDLGEELLLSGRSAKAKQSNRPGGGVSEAMRCVGGHVHGFPGLGDQLLASEAELHLTFEHREHLLEVVTVGRRSAAWWNMHIDECVLSSGVLTSHKDGVGVPDEAEVRKALVFVWSGNGEVSLRVVRRYGRSGELASGSVMVFS